MIRLLAIDLDGTLYNSQHQITPADRDAIHAAKEAGLNPVIVTGRGRRGAEMALDTLGLDLPFICSAGSLICAGKSVDEIRIISARTFRQPDELNHIIDFARRTSTGLIADGVHGNLWFGNDTLGESLDPLTAIYAYESRRTFNPERDFEKPLLKVTLVAEPDLLAEAGKLIITKCPSLHHTYAGMNYVDVTAKGVDKGSALEILSVQMNVAADEIAAIGDQPIDIPMLKYAGLSVAMENAGDIVKENAKIIAPSNDDNGVAWFIENLLVKRL
jgi:Cof subfamily protein (haloacid dehalogenase superfamily)